MQKEVSADLRMRREKHLADTMESVRIRMSEPYNAQLHDLIVYQQLHAMGVRISDMAQLIRKQLEREIPK
jgi:hypothetical protein